jgi:hypothetical protein
MQGECQISGGLTLLFSEGMYRQPLALSKLSTTIQKLFDGLRDSVG